MFIDSWRAEETIIWGKNYNSYVLNSYGPQSHPGTETHELQTTHLYDRPSYFSSCCITIIIVKFVKPNGVILLKWYVGVIVHVFQCHENEMKKILYNACVYGPTTVGHQHKTYIENTPSPHDRKRIVIYYVSNSNVYRLTGNESNGK